MGHENPFLSRYDNDSIHRLPETPNNPKTPNNRKDNIMKNSSIVIIGILVFVSLFGIGASCIGCTNARTPAGYEGYVYHDPIWLGHRHYVGKQGGPSSTGLVWRQTVINIDMRPETYTEKYNILTQDNLNISFHSHARIMLKKGSIKQVVEDFGAKHWYVKNVKQQYRAIVREEVGSEDAYDVKSKRELIAKRVLKRLKEQYNGTPVVFLTMSIGNIDYPDEVNREIERKLAAKQRMQRKAVEMNIAQKNAEIALIEAQGLAKAQKALNKTLTPLYVQYKAIEAYMKLAKSQNTTFVIMPTSPKGAGMPIILNPKK